MNKIVMETKVEEIKALEDQIKVLSAKADALRDELKKEMSHRGVDVLMTESYVIRNTDVTSSRFDTTGFRKAHGDLYLQYIKESFSKRFSINKKSGK